MAPDERPTVSLVMPASGYAELVDAISTALTERSHDYDPWTWVEADYEPIPSLTDAVVETYNQNRLPRITHVHQSSHVPTAIDRIQNLTKEAASEGAHVLVLVTGVPGSGKTMVGL